MGKKKPKEILIPKGWKLIGWTSDGGYTNFEPVITPVYKDEAAKIVGTVMPTEISFEEPTSIMEVIQEAAKKLAAATKTPPMSMIPGPVHPEVWAQLKAANSLSIGSPEPVEWSHPAPESAEPSNADLVSQMVQRIPGMRERVDCPECGSGRTVRHNVIHLNDQHKKTYAEIAEWLDTLDIDLSVKDLNTTN
jgi:hypothetical protein